VKSLDTQQGSIVLSPLKHDVSSKAVFVHRLFDAIAGRYDRFNRCASLGRDRGWRPQAVAEARLGAGMRVLDLCTGTGELALAAVAAVGETGLVVGVDFSTPMLQRAAAKDGAAQRLEWLRGDGQQLPFLDETFDRVLIGFSTRNFADLPQALLEMARVLRPEGRLVVLETGKPRHPLVKLGYYTYLWTVMPVIGWLVCGIWWPFRYLARSIRQFDQPSAFLARLREAGFHRVIHRPLSWGLADLFVAVR